MKILRFLILPLFIVSISAGSVMAQDQKIKIKTDTMPTALLIIDEQEFYFPGGMVPLVDPEAASEKTAVVLKLFREQNLPVIHIQHAGGTPIHKNVAPQPGEKVITKREANGFNGTDLLSFLMSLKIRRIVICGMQTQMCVEATTRAAYDFGFKCIVVEDACTTRNLKYGRRTFFANDVQACALTIMNGYYAKVVQSADLE